MLIAWRKATNLVSDTNSDWKTREIPIIILYFSSLCNPPTSSHSLLLITRSTIKCCLITVSTAIKTQIQIFVRMEYFSPLRARVRAWCRVFVRNKSEDYTLTGPVRSISYIYHVKEQFKVGYFVLTFISVTAIYW